MGAEGGKDKPLGIAIAGLGTVGAGVLKILDGQAALLSARAGRSIAVTGISARSRNQDRGVDLSGYRWFDNCLDMAVSDDVDVIIELIGGADGTAKALVETALANGKHVVTANKALLAYHGQALGELAESKDLTLAYEAAVAGGIPVIKGLREGLTANRVDRIVAILNGTCNFVLGLMEEEGVSFDEAVRAAQEAGFAEADPTTDIGGFDAAHKLALLASIAFGVSVDADAVSTSGIEAIEADDIAMAHELGYRIKLLAVAARQNGSWVQRVHPALVPLENALSVVSGPGNLIIIEGDWVGAVEFGGLGAGEGPTASAVVADIVDIARGISVPTFGIPARDLTRPDKQAQDEEKTAFYLRFELRDEKGVISTLTRSLADQDISIETMIQRPEEDHKPGDTMPVVVITYPAIPGALSAAVRAIEETSILASPPQVIRVEAL